MSTESRIRTVVVPLDGSPLAERALPIAATIARRCGAQLVLIRVHEPPRLAIAYAQHACDAVAMTTRSNGLRNVILGGVSDKLLRAGPGLILLVRPPERPAAWSEAAAASSQSLPQPRGTVTV
jgi:nucleotide-binding universal stress UspA family protein